MMGLLQKVHFRQIFLKSQSSYHGNRDHAKMAKSGQISICKPLNLGNVYAFVFLSVSPVKTNNLFIAGI